ncbi:hypothetical protein [Pseudomonas sp. FW300-N2F2]|uniref:hypothetical protein n=1 Tax=Pseudomonas sp. FW300-N2F2 TaxID=2751320 RepID=UPI001A91B48A|nr:hypothetical protein [Pseudomonas sp. FW300-N2F2]
MSTQPEIGFWQIMPIATSLLTLVFIYMNARFSIQNKQADLIIHFHKQFDEMQKKRCELLIAQAESASGFASAWSSERLNVEAEIFFDRFWSLQFDEFLAWYEGYLPTSIYIYWVFSRWRELHQPSAGWTVCGNTLVSTLENLKSRWQNNHDKSSKLSAHLTSFLGLMFALKQNAVSAEVEEQLGHFGPSRLRRFGRRLFGAH